MQIMIIRHAEKPHGDVRGVTPEGRKSKESLSPRGWQRAGALVQYFVSPGQAGVCAPTAIFASKVEAGEKSRRPRRTVEPLADWLKLEIDDRYGADKEKRLVAELHRTEGPALVCWHHEGIPTIARLLAPEIDAPASWPSDRFDLTWIFTQAVSGGWSFDLQPQLLLAGDSADICRPS